MTDLDRSRRRLDAGDAFVATDEQNRYAIETTAFDAHLELADESTDPRLTVTVRAPTLSAAVAGDAVADVVEDGWLETFQRRLEDAGMALEGDLAEPPTAAVDGDELVVEGRLDLDSPARAVADAKAFVEFVEGTYMEGVIPGYDYVDPVATMRDRAHSQQ